MASIVLAPARPPPPGHGHKQMSIFLAGTTSTTDQHDWRKALSHALAQYPVVILNPYRPDWDSTWREDLSDSRFAEQTNWELDMQDMAHLLVFYFHPDTKAPVSLLELGLAARSRKPVVVYCPERYWKRGNVQAVCVRHRLTLVDSDDELQSAVIRLVSQA